MAHPRTRKIAVQNKKMYLGHGLNGETINDINRRASRGNKKIVVILKFDTTASCHFNAFSLSAKKRLG